ncbi:MAG: DASS family sodium-coupled anion symporter [Chromatiaceae bacterium]|nr:MAG: DASS family sodium-coupled anion symporter [Chromatiaceae bacterium]
MSTRDRIAWIGLPLGPLLALAVVLLLPLAGTDPELAPAGVRAAAVALWMATWWLTEAVPLPATALLPVLLFPLLGVAEIGAATAPYASPLIFLFLGGFLLGLGIQRCGLHRRIALQVLLWVGASPRGLVGGFMLAAALLSMWISNTATAIMLLPIGASVLKLLEDQQLHAAPVPCAPARMQAFEGALVLGIAYACSIGGMGTLIGTPPNLVLAAFVQNRYGVEVGMVQWLGIGLPLVAVLLPAAWLYLTRIAFPVAAEPFPCGRAVIAAELARLGPLRRAEAIALSVFLLTALGWLLRPQLVAWTGLTGLTDAGIAMAGALSLFVLPVAPRRRLFALDWDSAREVPWGILILFGGGLSLAAALEQTGVDAFIATGLVGLGTLPLGLLVLATAMVVVLLSEVTSNTAVATTLMPVLAAVALVTGAPPGMLLTTVALAASCAFMLPVATPPNAIAFAAGFVSIGRMARTGSGLDLLAVLSIGAAVMLGAHLVLP